MLDVMWRVLMHALVCSMLLSLSLVDCSECEGAGKIPMSSRDFAKACCTVYPYTLGKHSGGFFEAGVKSDPHYFYKTKILSSDVIYVATPDLPDFINEHFLLLPQETRVVLVSGSEDIGAPYELFHPNRSYSGYLHTDLWPRGQKIDMQTFIADPRLQAWFVQNYDLVGCNHFSCSPLSTRNVRDKALIDKVIPIPIGLDFHTLSEKVKGIGASVVPSLVCAQRQDLQAVRDSKIFRSFIERPLKVNAEFGCVFTSPVRIKTRGEICDLLAHAREQGDKRFIEDKFSDAARRKLGLADMAREIHGLTSGITSKFTSSASPIAKYLKSGGRERKLKFWKKVSKCSFAIAPPGFGMDTHRFWEILQMHAVPIVIASPLDALYSMYPVVIVKRWSEIFEEGSLEKYKKGIVAKFGENPFNEHVMRSLTIEHWTNLVHATAHKA